MQNVNQWTEYQLNSYLAGAIDSRTHIHLDEARERAKFKVRTSSKKQALFLQSIFGGEIYQHRNMYELRYMVCAIKVILQRVAPYMYEQRKMLERIYVMKKWEIPLMVQPVPEYYVGGAIDAKGSFYASPQGKFVIPTFSYTFHSDFETLVIGQSNRSMQSCRRITHGPAKAFLEKISPYILEYEKYRIALHERQNEPFDPSVLSDKDQAYYERLQQEQRERAAQEKRDREEARRKQEEAKLLQEGRLKLVKFLAAKQRAIATQMKREWNLSAASMRKMIKQEYDAFGEQEALHDEWWEVAYRSKKKCRICEKVLPIESFGLQVSNSDGRKHECKRCAYDLYVIPNMEERRALSLKWHRENPEKARESRRRQAQKPQNKLRNALTKRIKVLLGTKTEHFNELVGCTPKQLVAHLESLFQPGMSWERKHEIHIDHIIPCRAFDLTIKEERCKCFHYTNLQPLWAKDNMAKSDKLPNGQNARSVPKKYTDI